MDMEGTLADTASTPPATLLHRAAHTLPALDKGTRCHLVGTRLRVLATLSLAGIRRRTARTLQVQARILRVLARILPADTPISRCTLSLVTLATVQRCLVMSMHISLVACMSINLVGCLGFDIVVGIN